MLSPAEPVVWMILFSRMVVLKNFLPREMERTAIGMEADTVRPALSARYTVEAPKIIPNMAPSKIDFRVSSAMLSVGEM